MTNSSSIINYIDVISTNNSHQKLYEGTALKTNMLV